MLERDKNIHLLEAFKQNSYRVKETAAVLGMPHRSFIRKLRELGIPPGFKGSGSEIEGKNFRLFEETVATSLLKLRS